MFRISDETLDELIDLLIDLYSGRVIPGEPEFVKRICNALSKLKELRNTRTKLQYNGEELTMDEVCKRLDEANRLREHT